MLTAGVDIGGTKVFALLVGEDGSVRERASHATDPEAGTASIVLALDDLIGRPGSDPGAHPRPAAIGIAAAAYVEYPSGCVAFAPKLTYEQTDVAEGVRHRFHVEV